MVKTQDSAHDGHEHAGQSRPVLLIDKARRKDHRPFLNESVLCESARLAGRERTDRGAMLGKSVLGKNMHPR